MSKLNELRTLMKNKNIDTYIITKYDPHQSEYSQECWNSVKFISNFTGSAGIVVVTLTEAGLWTDGRYYIQAEKELNSDEIILYKASEANTISYLDFAVESTQIGGTIGFNGKTISLKEVKNLISKSKPKKINIEYTTDLIDKVWIDKDVQIKNKIFEHDLKYSGKSRIEKLNSVRDIMVKENIDLYLLSSLDDIAWLFNLRGKDVEYCVVFESYAIITKNEAILFVDDLKIQDVKISLNTDNIKIKEYDEIFNYLNNINEDLIIGININRLNYSLYKCVEKNLLVKRTVDITSELKAVKNEIELQNIELSHVRDGVAMVKIIKWIKESVKKDSLTEYSIGKEIERIRSLGENYILESFSSIVGYMENGAILHYRAKKETSKIVENKGLLLIDSGATYLDGTTDITRTIALGEVTVEMKKDFTLVLKSHIALNRCIFMYGATGSNLDVIARMPMWENGLDYKSGTGHGIGYCLNVHEGPQNISKLASPYKLEKGIVLSNEPGVYKEGQYGIRTENIMVVKHHCTTEMGELLKFDVISYCPIDINAIDVSMLTQEELSWVNNYHKIVYDKLSPYLNEKEKEWLRNETKEI